MQEPLLDPPAGALAILRRLRQNGHEAYLCGGCVRDALLGKTPKDYDIAASAAPDAVEELFDKTIPIGKAFGVILVDGGDGSHYEVATFRSDLGYADGRRPDAVAFSTAQEDAQRRDFTMNALFYDPFERRVIDYVGGQDDIANRVLRTVGVPAERFREDHLRLLRAVRFAARTGFSIEAATWAAVTELAELVATVSPERIAAELEAMLTGGSSRAAFTMLKASGLLRYVLPEVDAMDGVEQPPDFHPEGDVWLHTLLLLGLNDETLLGRTSPIDLSERAVKLRIVVPDEEKSAAGSFLGRWYGRKTSPRADFDEVWRGETHFNNTLSQVVDVDKERGMHRGDFTGPQYVAAVEECRAALTAEQSLALAWSGLLHDIGKPGTITYEDRIRFNNHDLLGAEMAEAVLERLRRPRRVIDWNYDLIRRHIHFSTLRKMRKSKLRRWLQDETFPMHLELHRLDCVSSHRMLANWYFGVEAWREEKARSPEPEPLLRGGDLVQLGVQPGPEIGRLLRAVDDARLEGEVANREDALTLVRKLLSEGQG